jgi:hypothetical protein
MRTKKRMRKINAKEKPVNPDITEKEEERAENTLINTILSPDEHHAVLVVDVVVGDAVIDHEVLAAELLVVVQKAACVVAHLDLYIVSMVTRLGEFSLFG